MPAGVCCAVVLLSWFYWAVVPFNFAGLSFLTSFRLTDSNELSYRLSTGFRRGVIREIWQAVSGQHVYNLTSSSEYQENPTIKDILNHFDAHKNIGDNYGQRLTTFYRVSFKVLNPEEEGWSEEGCFLAYLLK